MHYAIFITVTFNAVVNGIQELNEDDWWEDDFAEANDSPGEIAWSDYDNYQTSDDSTTTIIGGKYHGDLVNYAYATETEGTLDSFYRYFSCPTESKVEVEFDVRYCGTPTEDMVFFEIDGVEVGQDISLNGRSGYPGWTPTGNYANCHSRGGTVGTGYGYNGDGDTGIDVICCDNGKDTPAGVGQTHFGPFETEETVEGGTPFQARFFFRYSSTHDHIWIFNIRLKCNSQFPYNPINPSSSTIQPDTTTATVHLYCDGIFSAVISRDGGDTFETTPIAENDDATQWNTEYSFTIDDITDETVLDIECVNGGGTNSGGLIATIYYEDYSFSTTNPIEYSGFAIQSTTCSDTSPVLYYTHNDWTRPDTINNNAYWIWVGTETQQNCDVTFRVNFGNLYDFNPQDFYATDIDIWLRATTYWETDSNGDIIYFSLSSTNGPWIVEDAETAPGYFHDGYVVNLFGRIDWDTTDGRSLGKMGSKSGPDPNGGTTYRGYIGQITEDSARPKYTEIFNMVNDKGLICSIKITPDGIIQLLTWALSTVASETSDREFYYTETTTLPDTTTDPTSAVTVYVYKPDPGVDGQWEKNDEDKKSDIISHVNLDGITFISKNAFDIIPIQRSTETASALTNGDESTESNKFESQYADGDLIALLDSPRFITLFFLGCLLIGTSCGTIVAISICIGRKGSFSCESKKSKRRGGEQQKVQRDDDSDSDSDSKSESDDDIETESHLATSIGIHEIEENTSPQLLENKFEE